MKLQTRGKSARKKQTKPQKNPPQPKSRFCVLPRAAQCGNYCNFLNVTFLS